MTFMTTKKKKEKQKYSTLQMRLSPYTGKKKKRVAVTLLAFTFFAFAKFRR